MLVVNWKGKLGYGDIVSPICYAHNVSYKLDTKVKLVFHWKWGEEYKHYPDDPETLMERASYIFDHCVKADVQLVHQYNSSMPTNFNHDNYDLGDDLHNFWYSTILNTAWSGDIVVNGTHGNKQTMAQYGKQWKDPVRESGWVQMIDNLKNNHNVVEVGYRTPIDKLFKILSRAKLFIGYHGNVACVAKFLQVPMIVFTSKQSLTKQSFPHACVKTSVEKDFSNRLDMYIKHSRQRLDQTLRKYHTYKISDDLVRSFKWT